MELMSEGELTAWPSNEVMVSPLARPAFAAGPPLTTPLTPTPEVLDPPELPEFAGASRAEVEPAEAGPAASAALTTRGQLHPEEGGRPDVRRSGPVAGLDLVLAIDSASLIGMAKPWVPEVSNENPWEAAVSMPITSPPVLTREPPESPG